MLNSAGQVWFPAGQVWIRQGKFEYGRASLVFHAIHGRNWLGVSRAGPTSHTFKFVGIYKLAGSTTLAHRDLQVVRWIYERRKSSCSSHPVYIQIAQRESEASSKANLKCVPQRRLTTQCMLPRNTSYSQYLYDLQ